MVDRLTPQEIGCIRGTCDGLRNEEIGARLGITTGVVHNHLMHAYEKLGVRGHSSPRTRAAIMLVAHDMESHTARLLRDQ